MTIPFHGTQTALKNKLYDVQVPCLVTHLVSRQYGQVTLTVTIEKELQPTKKWIRS